MLPSNESLKWKRESITLDIRHHHPRHAILEAQRANGTRIHSVGRQQVNPIARRNSVYTGSLVF